MIEVLGGCGWVAADFSAGALAAATGIALSARARFPDVLGRAVHRARSTYTWTAAAAKVEATFGAGPGR